VALSATEIARIAHGAGFRGRTLETAVAVALAESGGNPKAHNPRPPDDSYGLWQINMYGSLGPARRRQFDLRSNGALYDPAVNARAAWAISGRGSSFQPWSVYTNGAYRSHLGRARQAVARRPWADHRRGDRNGGGQGGGQGGTRDEPRRRDPWAADRPRRIQPWRRLRNVDGGRRRAMSFPWVDELVGDLTEFLAETQAVERVTREDARRLDIDRLVLARSDGRTVLRRTLHGLLDGDESLALLLRSQARDVDFVVRARASFRHIDLDRDRTVTGLTAGLTDRRGRRYHRATVAGTRRWLSAVITPPRRGRLPSSPPAGGSTPGKLPDRASLTGRLAGYGGRKFDSGVVPFVRALDRRFPGLALTSGWRSKAHNQAVGGVPNSLHVAGRAADFVGSEHLMQQALAWARKHGAVEALIHDAGSGRHLHVAW
jgi:hypothetical protein